MKTLRLIGMAIMMVLAAGCFTACGSDDDESDGSGDASNAASTLTSCVWQLYKAMDDECGEPEFNEMEIVDYPANGYSKGYRIRFNPNGGCTFWDWRRGKWDKDDELTPYTLKGYTRPYNRNDILFR